MLAQPKLDNGYDFCKSCTFRETETCDFCDDGDQFEEADHDATDSNKELAFA